MACWAWGTWSPCPTIRGRRGPSRVSARRPPPCPRPTRRRHSARSNWPCRATHAPMATRPNPAERNRRRSQKWSTRIGREHSADLRGWALPETSEVCWARRLKSRQQLQNLPVQVDIFKCEEQGTPTCRSPPAKEPRTWGCSTPHPTERFVRAASRMACRLITPATSNLRGRLSVTGRTHNRAGK